MGISMQGLVQDLVDETSVLRGILAPLDEEAWRRPTPAEGWTVLDQVTHLAHFDAAAVLAATDPEAFERVLTQELDGGGTDPDAIAAGYRDQDGAAVLRWFDDERASLAQVYVGLPPDHRLPWYGPSMSAASSVTARLMETWAHGQDVADTFGIEREPTSRLRHVAHLGVATRAFSFANHGLDAPDAPVRVELRAPGGDTWSWGPAGASDRVTGTALDFCLLVTQRRHRDDTDVVATGPAAGAWLEVAQAFAGDPGSGRRRSTST